VTEERVRLESTNTTRVANTSPTAASSGADLNGMAARLACLAIRERLERLAAEQNADMEWADLVAEAYARRIPLSAQAFYATPGLSYDGKTNTGTPFAYHIFGTAVVEATVDVVRGTYRIDAVHAVHDAGRSLAPLVDRGQAEGALLQGIGWMTIEEVVYDDRGGLLTGDLSTYKIPDLHFTPDCVDIVFLDDAENPDAVMGSKGIGEPPFMYGIGAYFAIRNALHAARPGKRLPFQAPLTHERVMDFLEQR